MVCGLAALTPKHCFWQDNSSGADILRAKGENFYLGLQLFFSQAGGRNESPPHAPPTTNPHTLQKDLVAGTG